MKLTFLGGADEVGGSSTLIEIGGHRILVDCGLRVHSQKRGPLPQLSVVHEIGGVEAVVITHAHLDHTGGLPAFYPRHLPVPIYMTPATKRLVPILLADAFKLMKRQAEEDGEQLLYTQEALQYTLGAMQPVAFGETVSLCGGDIRLTFHPAGHILGAASAVIRSDSETLLMTGDISVTPQKTIPGLRLPPVNPDMIVIESTYGGRVHSQRADEEKRLIQDTASVIARGGSVLFPAFAIGRSQEVILLLLNAIRRGHLQRVPIFVDGMSVDICRVYSEHPHLLTNGLHKQIRRYGSPFFIDPKWVIRVSNMKQRNRCAKTKPAIFVSPSGMLAGGPSQTYARQIATDPNNFIAITGYQDPSSPGRKLQELAASGQQGEVVIGEQSVQVKCRIGTYGLSAHADTTQLVECLRAQTSPHGQQPFIALVHGDHEAREALKKAIRKAGLKHVHRPELGESYDVQGPRIHDQASALEVVNEIFPLSSGLYRAGASTETTTLTLYFEFPDIAKGHNWEQIKQLSQTTGWVVKVHPFPHMQALEEMIHQLKLPTSSMRKRHSLHLGSKTVVIYPEDEISSEELEIPCRIYLEKTGFQLVVDSRHLANETIVGDEPKPMASEGKMEINRAFATIKNQFSSEAHQPIKVSRKSRADGLYIEVGFISPQIARQYQVLLGELSDHLGWQIAIRDAPDQHRILEIAKGFVPFEWEPKNQPSIHPSRQTVTIKIGGRVREDEQEVISAKFKQATGYVLDWVSD